MHARRDLPSARPAPKPVGYRPDIDGLRAIAVVPVVLYHYGVWPFQGGYIGVDIFFVISGFLITSHLRDAIDARHFSILGFYENRLRRIYPALFAMLFVSYGVALALLFPTDLKRFSESLLATAVFGSNFLFRNTAGYFDILSDRKPLLHTWSLAVEEQFYIVFPLLLFGLRGVTKRWRLIVVGTTVAASLGLSIWGIRAAPVSTFYLLPFRFWELGFGAILALANLAAPRSQAVSEALAAGGLGLIAYAVFFFSVDTPFPGEAALLPCVGAALLIHVGAAEQGTRVGRMLSLRPLVFVGLISYSLYLWHWPLMVFAKYAVFRTLTGSETAALILLSLVLATLSWRFVERPFRGSGSRVTKRQIFAFASAATVLVVGLGGLASLMHGLPQRFSPEVRAILDSAVTEEAKMPPSLGCLGAPIERSADSTLCRIGLNAEDPPSFILWGDSLAGNLMPAVAEAAIKHGRSGLFANFHACAPLLGVESNRSPGCSQFNDRVLRLIEDNPTIRDVVLSSFWGAAAQGVPYENPDQRNTLIFDAASGVVTLAEDRNVFARGLDRLAAALSAHGLRMIIVASVPEVGWNVPETLARIKTLGTPRDIAPLRQAYVARQAEASQAFTAVARTYGAILLYPDQILCPGARCMVAKDGTPIYFDAAHLNYLGAQMLEPLFEPVL